MNYRLRVDDIEGLDTFMRMHFQSLEMMWPIAPHDGGCASFAAYLRRQADLMDEIEQKQPKVVYR